MVARPAGLLLQAAEQGRLPRGVTPARSIPTAQAMPSWRRTAGEATAEAVPWGWQRGVLLGLPEGAGGWRPCFRAGWPAGCAPLRLGRLGGCLSLGGIMSSERNASAYE